nr:MAG: ORF1 [Torque teno midi virus]
MPFWWRRRRKPWYGIRFKRRYTYRRRRRRPRRYPRRYRKPYRRRRRRRKKVRRKLKKIIVKQWQPESIKKCKIKGLDMQCLGAQGTQFRCYTAHKYEWTIPRAAGGGGFSAELYTLGYLYQEWQYRNNIWTHSNNYMDLCRYTGCKFTFFSDPKTDFIIVYDIVPPFSLEKHTYMTYHPQQLLLRKHHKVLLSKRSNPTGKHKVTLKIKPPKQMSTKWFFQQFFSTAGLVNIITAAASFDYPELSCCNENNIITVIYLSPHFYYNSNWAQFSTTAYKPISGLPSKTYYKAIINNKEVGKLMDETALSYDTSIDYETGWFNPIIMNAYEVRQESSSGQTYANIPCGAARYNMNLDHGQGNKIWLCPVTNGHYNTPRDEDLFLENVPLWLGFYGYLSYLWQKKKDHSYMKAYMVVVKSDAIKPLQTATVPDFYPIIDRSFQLGNAPGNTYLDKNMKKKWYPTVEKQLEIINAFVQVGPFIPKYADDKDSTWQLMSRYCFYFKWGGPYQQDHQVEDPSKQHHWDVPDKLLQGVQASDPQKQSWDTIFKPWDYRRGKITEKALKRMYEHLPSDDSLFSDAETPAKKKRYREPPLLKIPEQENKEVQDCLQSLFEKSTSQESQAQTQDLYHLIQQQKQQQQQLKLNLFTLIKDLKQHQKAIQYQTGLLD